MGVLLWLKKRKVVVLIFVFSFIVSGLIINFLELLTVPLWWINKKLFRQINSRLVYFHWCVLPWALQSWANYDIRVFAPKGVIERWANTENALCILNHRGDLDWMIGWVLIERIGMLGGTKAIMKDVAKYLPGIGWTFLFMEYPFLKRDWKKDEALLKAACRNLADYPVKMLLCLFAEGTRYTKEKHDRSVEFCKSRGLPILKHHLFPRTKGFSFIMRELHESIPAIYDITICYRNGAEPSIMGVVNAESCGADVMVRRLLTSDIPTDSDDGMQEWLVKLYQEKDKLVEYHMKHGRFQAPQANVNKRIWSDIVVFTWLSLLGVPALLTALYLAWVGAWFTLTLIVASVILADQLFQYIAKETQVKHGSVYGLGDKDTNNTNGNTADSNDEPSQKKEQ